MKESTRRTVRTVLQVLVGLAALAPVLVQEAGVAVADLPWLATALVVAAVVTRIMAMPQVNDVLERVGIGMVDGRHELGRTGDPAAEVAD